MLDVILAAITVMIIQYLIILSVKQVVKKYYNKSLIYKVLFDDRYVQVGDNGKNLNKLF